MGQPDGSRSAAYLVGIPALGRGTRPPSAGITLILLPVVSIFLYLVGWVTGLMLYRREDRRSMAYILWISGVVSSMLFLLAVLFIVITPA